MELPAGLRPRALVIYGDGHLRRDNEWARDAAGQPFPTLTGLIEQDTKVFSIWSNTTVQLERIQANIASWKIPSLTILTGTRLGTLNFRYYAGRESSKRMEDEYDAILYLGPVSSISQAELSPELCADPAYVKMRLGRLALAPPGAAQAEMDRSRSTAPIGSNSGSPDLEAALTKNRSDLLLSGS